MTTYDPNDPRTFSLLPGAAERAALMEQQARDLERRMAEKARTPRRHGSYLCGDCESRCGATGPGDCRRD